MKVLSLFDGISCGMVALERVGIPVERYVAYEIEPNAIKISKKNYPQIEHCGDVTTADFTQYEGFDLLIGGSPCQSLSIVQSKTREHLDGKSKLFFEFVRALEEVKPTYFLFENVASMNDESKEAISRCLGCEPIFIDSADFSAQERPRLYWTNIPVNKKECFCGARLKDIMVSSEDVPDKYWYDFPIENIDMTKQVCGTLMHNNHEMHKRIFNPEFKCHTLTCVSGGNQQKKVLVTIRGTGGYTYKARKLMPIEYERLQTLPDGYTEGVADGHRYTAIGNGWTVDVIAHIFTYLKNERSKKEMEVRVEEFQLPEMLRFNYEELKQELEAKVSHYETLVYTDEQISEAKADRANLNKLKKALNDERIRMEREYMIPFNEFKAKINEIIGIIDKPVAMIDKQVKEFEEERKRRKLEEITEYKKGVEASLPAGIVIPVDDKWLNASVSIAKVKEAIDEKAAQIEKDIITLENLPEFSFEAVEVYKTTIDLNRAISEGHRLSEIAKRKAEHEAEQARLKAEAEAKKQEFVPPQETLETKTLPLADDKAEWISFKALLTVGQAKELKAFFESRQIEFQSI